MSAAHDIRAAKRRAAAPLPAHLAPRSCRGQGTRHTHCCRPSLSICGLWWKMRGLVTICRASP